ncbi:tripeptidyl-peptidase [Coniella lustricola]|uniref:tripeptidyl-peptidase II n=1 Tax=Coniella lustricola TaxID=2025994 RepID=A0A2T2ZTD3_9PEZI|nr:tripeptidyl-peptidase [Coniella lustricola]
MEALDAVPTGWARASPALASDRLTLHIALAHANSSGLEALVHALSDPASPQYGHHLSHEELSAHVAPSAEAVGAVGGWLAQHGIKMAGNGGGGGGDDEGSDGDSGTASQRNEWLIVHTNASTANALLGADFAWYNDGVGNSLRLRTLSYSVPDAIAPYVDLVQPTTRFGKLAASHKPVLVAETTVVGEDGQQVTELTVGGKVHQRPHTAAASTAGFCNTTVTPACLKAMYNIHYTASAADAGTVAFASYLGQAARYADLALFESAQAPDAVGQNISVETFNGGVNEQSIVHSSVEANLDAQYVVAISHPIPVVEYITGASPLVPSLDNGYPSTNEPYLAFLVALLAEPASSLPHTLTTSYGEEEQSVPRAYALKVCNLFLQLGLRGVSVVFSSGDAGPGDACTSNADNTTTAFAPNFPAGCPYVTSVGATTGSSPERGAAFSGGGFSIYHARPAWQQDAVAGYLAAIGDTYAGLYNASGRGIPDVAAQGEQYLIIDDGRGAAISGTSASAPTFAGVVALLNAARRAQGQSGLGFLNPWLYQVAAQQAGLADITTGFSAGCVGGGGSGGLPVLGARWNCTLGWDPVTGLGTPRFGALLEIAAPGTKNA